MLAADQSCPVTVTKTEILPGMRGDAISVEFRNLGDKPVAAEKFFYNWVDGVGDERPGGALVSQKKLKPGDKKAIGSGPVPHPDGTYPHAWVAVTKFADGSTWRDDGSHSCGAK